MSLCEFEFWVPSLFFRIPFVEEVTNVPNCVCVFSVEREGGSIRGLVRDISEASLFFCVCVCVCQTEAAAAHQRTAIQSALKKSPKKALKKSPDARPADSTRQVASRLF